MENVTNVEPMHVSYDEKLSPTLERCYNIKEKDVENENVNNSGEGNDLGTSTVPDEIAAKVRTLDIRKDEHDENNNHVECMETVRKQGETINTLVNQLCIMFQEYEEMNSEREYYEELNEALLRCLEITEGKLEIQDDSDEEEEEDIKNLEGKNEKTRIVVTPADDDNDDRDDKAIDESHHADNEVEKGEVHMDDVSMQQPGTSSSGSSKEKNETVKKSEKGEKKANVKTSELKRLNRILLREIFELRHQIEMLKENFRDYLNSEDMSQSEYDTATTDDDHASSCPVCMQGQHDDTESEEYEHQENATSKIADETDSD